MATEESLRGYPEATSRHIDVRGHTMHSIRGRRFAGRPVAVLLLALVAAGCSGVGGQGSADPAALSSLTATTSSPRTTSSAPTTDDGPTLTTPSTTTSTSQSEDSKVTETSGPGGSLIIGTDDFSVSYTVSTVWAQGLSNAGYRVGVRTFDGITQQIKALEGGQVDLILGYNAELLYEVDPQSRATSRSAIDSDLADAAPEGTKALRSAEANDGSVVIVSKTNAGKYDLGSLDDLSAVPDKSLTLALPNDSDNSKGLADEIKQIYGATIAKTVVTDYGGPKTLDALKAGTAFLGITSDSSPALITQPVVALKDPGVLFLPQHPVPLLGSKVDTKGQQILEAIDNKLTTAELRKLNQAFDNRDKSADEIALDWLKAQGLAS